MILRDTPGITKRHKYSRYYVTRAWNEIDGCDLIIFMIDGAKVVDNGIKEAIIRLNRLKN